MRIVIILNLVFFTFSFSKAEGNLVDSLQSVYPLEDIIILHKTDSIVIHSEKNIQEFESLSKVVLRSIKGNRFSEVIYYDDFSPLIEMDGSVERINELGEIEKSDQINKSFQNSMVSGIFYHDNQMIEVSYPFFSVGTIGSLSYEKSIKSPYMISRFIFTDGYPVLTSKLVVHCHHTIELGYHFFNEPQEGVQFTKVKNGDYITYTWQMSNLDTWDAYSSKEITRHEPHIALRIKEINIGDEIKPILSDTDDLYNYLYHFVDQVLESNQNLDSLSHAITKNTKSEEEKVKAIYDWVQSNINYVAFEDGYNGFIPRKPQDVCRKKYGDCKDMSLLLYNLLEAADLDAHLVWIGTDDIPYKIEEVLTPYAFNHMIAAVDINNERFWLDATAKYLDYRTPSSFVQGKQGLVSIDADSYEIVELPIVDIAKNKMIDSIWIEIDEKSIKGKRKYLFEGYAKIDFLFDIYRIDESSEEDLSEYFVIGNDSYHQTNFNILKNDNKRDQPAFMETDFTVDNYVRAFGTKTIINPILNQYAQGALFDTTKSNYVNFEYKSETIELTELKLNGLNIQNLPEDVTIDNELLYYKMEYVVKDGILKIERKVFIKKMELDKRHAPLWNNTMERIKKVETENLILVKT